jgi:MoxR-like ATPase
MQADTHSVPSPELTTAPATAPLSTLHDRFAALRATLATEVVGQPALIERLLIALLADGHLLVEGAPGVAKTTAVNGTAAREETAETTERGGSCGFSPFRPFF